MSAIKVGDLVQVVRGMPCCGHNTGAEGMCFVVSEIGVADGNCIYCNANLPTADASGCPGRFPITLTRLKRIPPLSELEGTKTDEPIKETA